MNSELPPDDQFTERFFARRTWLALAILVCNLLIFALLTRASSLPWRWTFLSGSDQATLINFGAKTNFWLWEQKQWFRFVTPLFLHIGVLHLATNAYALWVVGPIVERLYGTARFAWLYLLAGIGGVAGSVVGTRMHKLDGPVAGSSGALFGLFGVLLVVSFKYRHHLPEVFRRAFRKGVLTVVLINLVFGLLNNFAKPFTARFRVPVYLVDNWGHVAGLLTGALLAMILPYQASGQSSESWRERVLLICFLLLVSYCFLRAYQVRPFVFHR